MWKLMSYCFTEHGIIPSEFDQFSFEDKVIMLASLQDKIEKQQEELKKVNKGK